MTPDMILARARVHAALRQFEPDTRLSELTDTELDSIITAASPQGDVITVPRVPTEAIIRSMRGRALMADCTTDQGARDIYSNIVAASPASKRNAGEVELLGRFGFHPDPAIDFLCEVEAIEGEAYDVGATGTLTATLLPRIDRAMTFRVGGDASAVKAKIALRQIECAVRNGTIKSFMDYLIAQRSRGVELYKDAGK